MPVRKRKEHTSATGRQRSYRPAKPCSPSAHRRPSSAVPLPCRQKSSPPATAPIQRGRPHRRNKNLFFTKLPVGTYIRLLFLIIRRIPPATRKAIPPTSRTGPDAEEESSTFDEKNRRHSPTAQKRRERIRAEILVIFFISGCAAETGFRQQKCFDSYGLKILFLLIVQ